jgi:CheY-like chemotaxis protein
LPRRTVIAYLSTMPAPVLLVVDDDLDICEILKLVLEDEGYSVVAAHDGAQALELLKRQGVEPQLIILDLMMPVMDGWRFWDERQLDAKLLAIPLIVLTATGLRTGALGDACILPKPVEREVLLQAIADAQRANPRTI